VEVVELTTMTTKLHINQDETYSSELTNQKHISAKVFISYAPFSTRIDNETLFCYSFFNYFT